MIGQLVIFGFSFFAYVELIGVFWISSGKNSSAAPNGGKAASTPARINRKGFLNVRMACST